MTDNAFDDYGQDIEEPDHKAFEKLNELVAQYTEAAARVEKLTDMLGAANEAVRQLLERDIPELMDEIHLAEFKTKSGMTIQVDEKLRANISAERGPEAYKWLEDNGHGGIIKNDIKISLGRDQNDEADAILEAVEDVAQSGTLVERKQGVHYQTLVKFIKDGLEAGEEIPLDLFGVFRQRVAKVKAPK